MERNARDSRGFFSKIRKIFKRNRLGELLVQRGFLTVEQLRDALYVQKQEDRKLGDVLLSCSVISRRKLFGILVEQWTLRKLMAFMAVFVFCTAMGAKNTKAASLRDLPPTLTLASTANSAFAPMNAYPAVFNSSEKRSSNIQPFSKWTDMFSKFDRDMRNGKGGDIVQTWKADLTRMQGLPLKTLAHKVNRLVNSQPYVLDNKNWGKSDYWATPIEFFQRGGDCEDFAITKYVSLRALGVPEERLRVAIVHDMIKDIPHAVLIVYTDDGALILDNQVDEARDSTKVTRYRPIFSINSQAWWLHTSSKTAMLASAD